MFTIQVLTSDNFHRSMLHRHKKTLHHEESINTVQYNNFSTHTTFHDYNTL